MLFILFFFLTAAAVELYNSTIANNYTLGPNLFVNPSLDLTPLSSIFEYFSNSIQGWTCINKCEVQNTRSCCNFFSMACNITWNQAFELDPGGSFPTMSQAISINTSGPYLLHLEWMPALANPINKAFTFKINSTVVDAITVLSSIHSANIEEYLLNLVPGTLNFTIKMTATTPDMSGIVVSNFKLMELIPISSPAPSATTTNSTPSSQPIVVPVTPLIQNGTEKYSDPGFEDLISRLMLNNLTTTLNTVPGSRIFVYTFMNFLSTFDRLQFYYFHRQNLSYYSYILLSNVNTLAQDRGNILQGWVEDCSFPFCASIISSYSSLAETLNYKQNYSTSSFIEKNNLGEGFWVNNIDFFYFEMPVMLVMYLCLCLLFKLLFNYRISLLFRKYSFCGLLLVIFYEGNMEQFSFYFFLEVQQFFSLSGSHKITNVVLVLFFFIAIVFAVGGLVWFKFHYRKWVKYFTEQYTKIHLRLLVMESLERSLFPLLFGCVHALLLGNLALQTIILGAVEVGYLYVKVLNKRARAVKFKLKIVFLSVTSMLRMSFIATFYLFQVTGQPELINLIHRDLVYMYLLCWLFETFYEVVSFMVSSYREAKKPCRPKKMTEVKQTSVLQKNRCWTQLPLSKSKQNQEQKTKKKVKKNFERGGSGDKGLVILEEILTKKPDSNKTSKFKIKKVNIRTPQNTLIVKKSQVKDFHQKQKQKCTLHQMDYKLKKNLQFTTLQSLLRFLDQQYDDLIAKNPQEVFRINNRLSRALQSFRSSWIQNHKNAMLSYIRTIEPSIKQKEFFSLIEEVPQNYIIKKYFHFFIFEEENVKYFTVRTLGNKKRGNSYYKDRYFCAGELMEQIFFKIERKMFKKDALNICQQLIRVQQKSKEKTGI